MKKLGIAFLLLVAIGGGAGFWLYRYTGAAGSSELEQWVARQVVGILEAYITPKITFEQIDYQAPRTVVIDNLNIVADDDTPMVALQRILLELAETPRRGKPIKIARIEVERPDLNIVARDGTLVGWGNFVKQQAVQEPDSVPDDRKLSEVFELRHLSVTDAKISFDDPRLGNDKMVLTDITFSLDTPPAKDESNAHLLDFVLQRKPLIDVKLEGKINLDTGLLELSPLVAEVRLEADTLSSLPPNMQEMLRNYNIDGTLHANVEGEIPLRAPQEANASADVRMSGLGLDLFGFRGALGELTIKGNYPDGPLNMNLADFSLVHQNVKFVALAAVEIALKQLGNDAKDKFHFDKVSVAGPEVRLVRTADNRLVGWSELADFATKDRKSPTSQPVASSQQTVPKITFDEAAITDGLIEFRQTAAAEPLQIKWNSAIKPQQDQSAYDFAADMDATGLSLTARGLFDQDAQRVRMNESKVTVNVQTVWPLVEAIAQAAAQFGVDSFSPADVKKYQPSGAFTADFSGDIPLDAPLKTGGNLTLNIDEGNFATDDISAAAKGVVVQATLPGGPAEIAVNDVSLTSERNKIFTVDNLTAKLSTFDANTRAATIDNIHATNPVIVLIANGPDSYVGWTTITNPKSAGAQQATQVQPTQAQTASNTAPPSIIFREAIAEGGKVVLQSSADGDRTRLSFDGKVRTAQQPESYDFDAKIGSIGIEIDAHGFVDARNRRLRLDKSRIQANFERARPILSELLRLAKVDSATAPDLSRLEGRLEASGTGDFSTTSISNAAFDLTLRNARLPVGAYLVPIAALDAQGRSQNGQFDAALRGQLLDGSINADIKGQSSGQQNFSGTWNVTDLQLEEALKVAEKTTLPMAGKFSSAGRVKGALGQLPQSLQGEGSLDVREGRLVKLPVIADLLSLIEKTRLLPKGVASDTADAQFQINGNGIHIVSSEVLTSIAAMRAIGDVGYDGSLNLDVNAGVMEKVQGQLGQIGDILGKITDKAFTYTVTGNVKAPKIGVKTMGVGLGGK